ncbi:hypothetical protein BDY17DRAFT_107292 [Neohortaea acidophila]|uniref:Uncharacterized protein n=1 Tax=Neohortaea acidophila TaxID=245834 RepID=A0A6A6PZX5_9PEZI|nr:uncharacterized protein BDY17DRAFT_107292 [Neohortaea acidophila]KAF2485572.1 hypothetical protein BDY17DRAFT_107292 [Neohortaea acidophila]
MVSSRAYKLHAPALCFLSFSTNHHAPASLTASLYPHVHHLILQAVNPHASNMCHYDCIVFECGDWKWGPFRKHCHKEYRMGETCGMKLLENNIMQPGKCTICQAIERKERRYEKAVSDYKRFSTQSNRTASAAKAKAEAEEIWAEMEKLKADRAARYMNVGSNRRANPAPGSSRGRGAGGSVASSSSSGRGGYGAGEREPLSGPSQGYAVSGAPQGYTVSVAPGYSVGGATPGYPVSGAPGYPGSGATSGYPVSGQSQGYGAVPEYMYPGEDPSSGSAAGGSYSFNDGTGGSYYGTNHQQGR